MLYPIAETFLSIQGEGIHCGKRAFFIRVAGCPVKCAWCDTKYSWNIENAQKKSEDELADIADKSGARIVVITGGEPCMYDLIPLVNALRARGIASHIETSGVCGAPNARVDFIALSPKLFSSPKISALEAADELKLIISSPSDIAEYEKIACKAKNAKAIWLNPEWSKSKDATVLDAIVKFVMLRGGVYRAGWQLHKNYFVR